jgi:hypothetical protein
MALTRDASDPHPHKKGSYMAYRICDWLIPAQFLTFKSNTWNHIGQSQRKSRHSNYRVPTAARYQLRSALSLTYGDTNCFLPKLLLQVP